MNEEKTKKESKKGSSPRHGKSRGVCAKCGAEYALRKHHGHRAGVTVRNGICGSCNKRDEFADSREL